MIGHSQARMASERHKRVKYSSTFSPFAVAVAVREYMIALALAPFEKTGENFFGHLKNEMFYCRS